MPALSSDAAWRHQLSTWLTELSQHDLEDMRGLVSGLAIVLGLIAVKLPEARSGIGEPNGRDELRNETWRQTIEQVFHRKEGG